MGGAKHHRPHCRPRHLWIKYHREALKEPTKLRTFSTPLRMSESDLPPVCPPSTLSARLNKSATVKRAITPRRPALHYNQRPVLGGCGWLLFMAHIVNGGGLGLCMLSIRGEVELLSLSYRAALIDRGFVRWERADRGCFPIHCVEVFWRQAECSGEWRG